MTRKQLAKLVGDRLRARGFVELSGASLRDRVGAELCALEDAPGTPADVASAIKKYAALDDFEGFGALVRLTAKHLRGETSP